METQNKQPTYRRDESTQIQVKISQSDKDLILRASNKLTLPHSAFMRMCALKEARNILFKQGVQSN